MEGIKNNFILAFIAFSLCVAFYGLNYNAVVNSYGKSYDFKFQTFNAMHNGGFSDYKKLVYQPWRGRLFSALSANGFMHLTKLGVDNIPFWRIDDVKSGAWSAYENVNNVWKYMSSPLAKRIAYYNTIWFALCLSLVLIFSKNKMLFLFGFLACSVYTFTPIGKNIILPWDWPSVFFWTLALFSVQKNRKFLLPIIAIGMGFKETIFILSAIPFFWNDLKLKDRMKAVSIHAAVCLLVKAILDIAAGNDSIIFTMLVHFRIPNEHGEYWLISQNLRELSTLQFNHIIFSAGGLIAACLMLPKMYKTIALIYVPFLLAFCVMSEVRLYNELIPLFFIGMESKKCLI